MAARFKIRDSYSNDAANMLKLAEAIERDNTVTLPVKREVISMLHALTTKLLRLKDASPANASPMPAKKAANK
jgi:hypothetical protein